jgi:serine/threonine protein kinase
MSTTPAMIGNYAVERELGSGGMGEVYLAFSPAGDPVAVKLIRADRLDPVARGRFEREAEIARTIVGTNRVARFLHAEPFEPRPWLAMEYVPGHTLHAYVGQHSPLPAPLTASTGALLAEGLSAVHAAGLVHRDLKPQNVIMSAHGPMLIDFGLGAFVDGGRDSLSQSGMIIGTVRCMAPEQASGNSRVTPAADVYGLGAVLLFAATGHYPYDGDHWRAITMQVANPDQAPNLDDLPDALRPLISSMLSHDPAARPTLDMVTAECARIMALASLSPANARHALISLTTQDGALTNDAAPSRSVVRLLVAQALVEEGVGESSSSDSELPENEVQPAAEVNSSAPAEPAVKPRTQTPASHKIAEELRQRYAMQSGL